MRSWRSMSNWCDLLRSDKSRANASERPGNTKDAFAERGARSDAPCTIEDIREEDGSSFDFGTSTCS